ncbi:right-handed parallel beta-helix repeat-containing protein [Sphingobacterium athyrii]|uniref:Pectate lyase superfamily protein domain-containing protein n=1 Tax=Sphingobacterium athyrii TaxID=2152717 RepID=A0A363NU06_9SPHI|nr:right-handed parallel beta-helix repeat-containing protein [Sphingobacterium athyrii]PUV24131.1 hypothetical protein DCO56_12225 [Sphingobacterium athyrii]
MIRLTLFKLGMLVQLLLGWTALSANIINVTEFGVIPDDGQDDRQALQLILDSLKDGDKVYFPSGTYSFSSALRLSGKIGIEIYGSIGTNTSTLMATGFDPFSSKVSWTSLLEVRDCKDLVIRDLFIDVDKPVSINGTIADIGNSFEGNFYILDLLPEFAEYASRLADLKIMHQLSYDADGTPNYHISTHFELANGNYPRIEKLGTLRLKIYNDHANKLTRGEHINLRLKITGNPCFSFLGVNTLTIRDITIWQWPAFAMYVSDLADSRHRSSDMTLQRIQMKPKPTSGRLMSISADGIHVASMSGTFKAERCEFVGLGDDAINIHSRLCTIGKISADSVLLINGWTKAPVEDDWAFKDDIIEFLDGKTGLPKGKSKVRFRDKGHYQLQSIPKNICVGDFAAKDTRTPSTIIRDCMVSNSRARGFVVQSNKVVVSNNKIWNISGPAILLSCDMDRWFEATTVKKALITGNRINNCGKYLRWGDTLTGYGAIAVKTGHEIGGIDKPAGVHRNITIRANTISDCANSAIFVSSTDGVKISKNRIENSSHGSSIPYYGNYAIYLKNCVNDQVFDNSFNQVKKLLGKD